jgi:hypothetical protein
MHEYRTRTTTCLAIRQSTVCPGDLHRVDCAAVNNAITSTYCQPSHRSVVRTQQCWPSTPWAISGVRVWLQCLHFSVLTLLSPEPFLAVRQPETMHGRVKGARLLPLASLTGTLWQVLEGVEPLRAVVCQC